MQRRSYAIIGVGAIGGWYGGQLIRAGHSVHLLVRAEEEARHIRAHGLRVDSDHTGSFIARAAGVTACPRELPWCDVVLVSLKTTETHRLASLAAPALPRGGVLLMMQNGLGVEEQAATAMPSAGCIAGGLAFVCAHKIGPGHVRHLDYGRLLLGAFDPSQKPAGITKEVADLAEDFVAAGVDTATTPDLMEARWRKLIWNIPFSGLCVVHDCRTDKIVSRPDLRERAWTLMREVQTAARGCGRNIEDAFLDKMMRDTEIMTPYSPSMKLDFDQGRLLEITALYDAPIAAATRQGVRMPETARLRAELQARAASRF